MQELQLIFSSSNGVRVWPKKVLKGAISFEQPTLFVVGSMSDEQWKSVVRMFKRSSSLALLERLKRLASMLDADVILVAIEQGAMVILGRGEGGVWSLSKGVLASVFTGVTAWSGKQGKLQRGERYLVSRTDRSRAGELLSTRKELWPQTLQETIAFEVKEVEKPMGFSPTVYLKGEKRQKTALIAGIVLLLLLLLSVGLGWKKREAQRMKQAYEQVVTEASQLADEAEEVRESNPTEARGLMEQALQVLQEQEAFFAEDETFSEQLSEQTRLLEERYRSIAGLTDIEGVSLWFDLSAVREDVFGEVIVEDEGVLAILDKSRGVVVSVDVEDKEGSLASGGNLLVNGADMDFSNGRAVVLSGKKVVEVSVREKTSALLVESGPWERASHVGFFGGNVYVVEEETGDLWRFPSTQSGVGEGRSWFGPGVQPTLTGVVDMSIDGDIWLAFEDGEIQRYRQGASRSFSPQDVDGDLSGLAAIETGEDLVYVLQPTMQRIVILDKEGVYQEQLSWEGLAAANDMAVDEEERALFVLSGSSIYRLEL